MAERIIHFNALSEDVRKDLIDSFSLQRSPVPTLRQEEPYLGTLGWMAALLVCALGGGLFLGWYELGKMYGDFNVQPWYFILGYMLAFGLAGVAIGVSIRRVLLQRALPYWPGLYLYGVDLIDARTSALKLVPMASLKTFNGVHHHTNGAYTHTAFAFTFESGLAVTFTINGKDQAEAILATIRDDGRALARAAQEGDVDAFIARDPLFKARTEPNWNTLGDKAPAPSSGPAARELPALVDKLWQPLAAAGLVVAVPFWLGRELVSDHYRWAQADVEDSSSIWEEYLQGGWWQATARGERLPAAAFREAKERGTVSDLRAFIERFPESKEVPEARAAIHEIFVKALTEFRSLAADDPKAVAFMEALVAWLEKNDSPPVDVRFLPPSATALGDMDAQIKLDAASFGAAGVAEVASHFTGSIVSEREGKIVENLQKGFAHVFPHDVMSLQQGAALSGEGVMAPDRPGIRVQYDVRPSGSMYEDEKTGRAFVGIAVQFDVEMTAPGAEPIDLEFTVQPPSHFTVETRSYGGIGGEPSDGKVYDQMAIRAYDALVDGIERAFFKTLPDEPLQAPSDRSPGHLDLPDNLGLDPATMERLRKELESLRTGP